MNKSNDLDFDYLNKEGAIFMGAKRSHIDCEIGIIGVEYDGTTSFRPGARFGPSAIKDVSNGIETFCPQLNIDLKDIQFADLGYLNIPLGPPEKILKEVNKVTKLLINKGIKPLIIGGEHSITVGVIEAISKEFPNLILLQLDAHADLRESWTGLIYSHACTMKRCLEVLPSKRLFQLGIRSGTKEEFEEINANKRLILHKSGDSANHLRDKLRPFANQPIYLTIDLDWFDPSVLPGTGTPEPGGYYWNDFAAIIEVLKEHYIIGGDIVELAPNLDNSGISSILAAKTTRSLLMLLSLSKLTKTLVS